MSVSAVAVSASRSPLVGVALVVMATFLLASHDAFTKYLSGFYSIVLVVWARYAVHTSLMAVFFLPRSGVKVLRSQRPLLQGVRALCLLATSLLFVAALAYIPLAEATAVNFVAPLLVTALSMPLLGERVSPAQWLAVITGFVGVLMVVHPGSDLFTPAILLPLGSALCFCFYQLLTRVLSKVDSPVTSNFLTGLINTVLMSMAVPFFWAWPTAEHALMLFTVGAFGMLAHQFITNAYHHAPPALLAPLGYSQIVFAGLLGFVVFKQLPAPLSLVGIAVVCASGLAVVWLSQRAVTK